MATSSPDTPVISAAQKALGWLDHLIHGGACCHMLFEQGLRRLTSKGLLLLSEGVSQCLSDGVLTVYCCDLRSHTAAQFGG